MVIIHLKEYVIFWYVKDKFSRGWMLLLKEMSALKFRTAAEKLYLPRLHFFLLNKSVDFSRHIYMVTDEFYKFFDHKHSH